MKDLLGWAKVDASSTWVVPLAARKPFFTVRSHGEKDEIRRRYRLQRPFLLYVGNIEPRKNLAGLLDAFGSLDQPGVDLVLAGRRAWRSEPVVRKARELAATGTVHMLDYVPEDDLPALYQSALALVYPSFMEGFGLPVLEAMASGLAVIVSDVEPLRSLVSDAGWLVRPGADHDLQAAISEAIRLQPCWKFSTLNKIPLFRIIISNANLISRRFSLSRLPIQRWEFPSRCSIGWS